MDATLKLSSATLAYADLGATSNPLKRYTDWQVQRSYQVRNPVGLPLTIAAGDTVAVFSGTRSTSIASNTSFLLSLSPLSPVRYRFTNDAGTAPALRTARGLVVASVSITATANANATLTLSATSGTFTGTVAGDTIFIPSTSTGDSSSPFSALNVGYWVVLTVAGAGGSVQLARPAGMDFSGVSEVVVPGSNSQLQAFSAAGVQVGDKVSITAGFDVSVQSTYSVVAVNPSWFEILAIQPLPTNVSAVPGVAGIQFYTTAKRYIRVEADQECILRLNGDATDLNRLTPWVAGDADNSAFFEKVGPTWSATIINKSSVPLNVLFISAE